MKYEALPVLDRDEAERRLCTADLDELRVTVAALDSVEDTGWVVERLEGFVDHHDVFVAGNAVIGLSELVRTGRLGHDEVDRIRAVVTGITREDLKGRVRSALGDIDNYLRHTR